MNDIANMIVDMVILINEMIGIIKIRIHGKSIQFPGFFKKSHRLLKWRDELNQFTKNISKGSNSLGKGLNLKRSSKD
ncbi:MAG: hypothetical protein JW864_15035 [Spirochaetes bacterium]|nr:hypothetical protein [Spirochaetota bacterium]